ncbi:hypothetical protein [Pseudoalteromonas sp. R3]|uniref:hypothetical protein n=1 Tax=Pseudoalteromonas sp. R3 TaxID=1709477 RepID=UPI0006B55A99|nr:hypothetical protein [Pseudoalteromonas sp. R3]AZZ98281.1 hypothetical protein ELR70_14835 [Pseudoalteromonas sp. R3]
MKLTAEQFNEQYSVGSGFIYQSVMTFRDGEAVKTASDAWTMCSGEVVVKLQGKSGCFSVDHLTYTGK